ncbi:MAG: GDSL-type esterase/lipase family protein [Bacteroidales bacterium]|nr:GDSL-type esterase/lipase family protein [Bacteroidales bacterium]
MFCLLLIATSHTMQAQSIFREIPPLDFINKQAENIIFPAGDTNAYREFFEKLDRLIFEGQGNVNILHLGGSHIQAGTFSDRIRSNLLSSFSGITGNRGLIFPFSVVPKSNNPHNYRTTYSGSWDFARNVHRDPKYPLGLSGMCIATADSNATVSIKMRNSSDLAAYDFNKIYVLGHCDSGYVRVRLQVHDSLIVDGKYDPVALAYCFELDNYVDSFKLFFSKKDTLWETFYLRGFWLDNGMPGVSYVDIGVNGASVPSYLRCTYLEKDLAFVKPDLCIFSIGINDASGSDFDANLFINNYKELIRRIRTVAPDCMILFITNNDSYRKAGRRYISNTNGLLAKQAFYSLAQYYKTGVWDLFTCMGGLTSIRKWESRSLAQRDRVHFTSQGYVILGDLLYNAIIREYIKHLQSKHIIHGLD